MALTKPQWERVGELTNELRAMGCAVCVFTPDDADDMAIEDDMTIGPDFIYDNRSHIEDSMSSAGNQTIDTLLSMQD